MIARTLRCLVSVALISGIALLAEGFKFKDGRLDQEKVIELKLTPSQSKAVEQHFKPGMVIHLTKAQQAEIRAKSGVKVSPTQIEIWKPANLEKDCTCFFFNLGLLYKPGWVELPVFRLCSDQEAIENRAVD